MAQRHSRARTAAHTSEALAEFHELAGHPGTIEYCADCAAVLDARRRAEAALRAHRRATRRQIDRILGRSS